MDRHKADAASDYYGTLDLPRSASDADIKRRYRQLMRQVHPDANGGDPAATQRAARINRAFETLGNLDRRREYDRTLRGVGNGRSDGVYAHWAEQPDWEDIVAEHVPPRRPRHVHDEEPLIEPEAIEVDMAELRDAPRVRRRVRVTNRCGCTITGDVATSESWLWGPVGPIRVGPHASTEFDLEVVSRKVRFPGLSRAVFVTSDWTGVVPVTITGFATKPRRTPPPAADMAYARPRRRRWSRGAIVR